MPEHEAQPVISVGGPLGIHLHTGQPPPATGLAATSASIPLRMAAGGLQRWIAAHGRTAALVIVGLGCAVLALATALIRGMDLPGLLYIPALLATGTLWIGALAAYAVHRASRRALATATERQILHLAAQTGRPLTVPEVARSLGLSLNDAEAALTTMARAGHTTADVDLDTGHLQFTVPLPHSSPRS